MRTNFIVESVLSGLRRNVTMTIALILNTAITLAFVGAALLANQEISQFKRDYESRLNVSVFVCGTQDSSRTCPRRPVLDAEGKQVTLNGVPQTTAAATSAQTDTVREAIAKDPAVASFSYVSADKQYDRAKHTLPSDTTKNLRVGDLPPSFTVKLKNIKSDYVPFVARVSGVSGVGQVLNVSSVLKTLLDTIDGFRLFAIVIALVVLVASILLIANTIQVAAQQRRNETSIMRLVGASRWMTELPFLLETAVAALVGGIVAGGMVFLGKYFVLDNIFSAQTNNGVIPDLGGNDIVIACGAGLIGGIIVSALTAFLTLRLYVKL